MNREQISEFGLEPERYELQADSQYRFDLNRRQFFKGLGGGIVVFLLLPVGEALAQQESGARDRRGGGRGQPLPQEIGAWLHIGEDGTVTAYTGKVDVGQGSRTELTQVVAEELRIPVASVRMVMGDTDLVPYDMGTFGSQTTPQMVPRLRRAAAAAREVLIDLAAAAWSVDRKELVAADGKVAHPSSKHSSAYGPLSKGQKIATAIPDDVSTTPTDQWKTEGQPVAKVDGRSFVTGQHKYASDMNLPDMLHGKVLRPPAFHATLDSADTKEAEGMPGVTVVRDGNFMGVAAPNESDAMRAVAAIRAEWKSEPQPSSREIFDYLKKNSTGGDGRSGYSVGSMEEGLAAADKKLTQNYTVAYIAHAPLEPRAAAAEWKDDKLTVWTGSQRPFGVRAELATAFRIPETNVRVIVPDTGAGYGGKHSGEAAVEAARLAKAAGKPVKVVWTREEEFTWAYFRPAGAIDISSGARSDGTITAWEFHNYNSGGSGIRTPYEVANQRIEFHPVESPLRQGSYRALAATANHFARETHMDELARLVKMDPLEFRRKNLKDARLGAVLDAAARSFGWGKTKASPGQGFGIAGGSEKGGYVATCAAVSVDRAAGTVKVVRVVTAFECGTIINPDNLKNQVEGAVIMGIGGALFEAIEFENGRILNPHFSTYRVPRFTDAPALETVLIDRKDLPSAGAGESPILTLAPAVGNAIFDATGIRLRSLPMIPDGLKQEA
jgi:nicotinate dehydrogenase subunit B